MEEFRKLKAEEIEVRIGRDFKNGYVELLLYKNARVDMRLLDEKYGLGGWQVDYKGINGVLFCGIGFRNVVDGQWIWKWNAGAESNIEKEKGAASDSFKRAGFVLGIGRELYTAPRIIVQADKFETFKVADIQYEGDSISALKIVNGKGDVVFNYPGGANTRWSTEMPEKSKEATSKTNSERLTEFCSNEKKNPATNREVLLKFYNFYSEKINGFDRTPNIEKLWNNWVSRERS